MTKVLITSGPTIERIDPVRYLSNFSSGKQGHSIATAFAKAGAEVVLVSGPVALPHPEGITVTEVESAQQMLEACLNALPADIAIFTAAVCDWRPEELQAHKIKKESEQDELNLKLVKNPDILATVAQLKENRPHTVVGFAAETENLIENAQKKLTAKGCDMILANDVSAGVFGENNTHIYAITKDAIEDWGQGSKSQVADRLVKLVEPIISSPQLV